MKKISIYNKTRIKNLTLQAQSNYSFTYEYRISRCCYSSRDHLMIQLSFYYVAGAQRPHIML